MPISLALDKTALIFIPPPPTSSHAQSPIVVQVIIKAARKNVDREKKIFAAAHEEITVCTTI
ncbi:hypothetical protein D9611_008651 [Ephemerocybe angulata]|uniref:Uncharacterized protein n=1 Tax=Ephemerocybe angulata TaxID=980116 RepID=A0A8H5B0E6_9AGAR|nr:hypothetical protein D9611_008651 [Tulosesus angulatus]